MTTDIHIDRVVRSWRRSISIHILDGGVVEVRAPQLTPTSVINQFVKEKSQWISGVLARQKEHPMPKKKTYHEGEVFLLAGDEYTLHLTDGSAITLLGKQIFFPQRFVSVGSKKMKEWYVEQARKITTDRLRFFGRLGKFDYSGPTITDAKTRWGSCSGTNGISFSWKLVMAPMKIIDYVVIHELCHTVHHDHSVRFWSLIGKFYPEYSASRTWLRRNGHGFSI
jgi:predicted metal-dependent hydrolase